MSYGYDYFPPGCDSVPGESRDDFLFYDFENFVGSDEKIDLAFQYCNPEILSDEISEEFNIPITEVDDFLSDHPEEVWNFLSNSYERIVFNYWKTI